MAERSLGFSLVRGLIQLLLAVFYRRTEVVGAERVPAQGGLIVAANHHNSVVDAMVLLAVVPRRLRTLAKAQLFEHPMIGPFLRMLGALPVHRRQEAGDDPRKNDALFEATTRTLGAGGGIIIFPEGRTQPDPVLLELRTGAARMLFAAHPGQVTLLPAGLVFRKPGVFREGEALILFGEPVPTQDLQALARTEPERAARELTERLSRALRDLIIEAQDLETLRLLEIAQGIWGEETGAGGEAQVRWLQQAAQRYHRLLREAPERVAGYAQRLQQFSAELESAGLTLGALGRSHSAGQAAGFALLQGLALLIGAPLALLGILIHGLPYALVGAALRLIPHTGEEEATDKIAAGLVFYPLLWCLEGWLLWRFAGAWALVAFLVLLVPAGFFALSWRKRLASMAREVRGFARLAREPGLLERLRGERDALQRELKAMAADTGAAR
jgi:1-acyl-sn-glycerol-3-phosphate acyltransferase